MTVVLVYIVVEVANEEVIEVQVAEAYSSSDKAVAPASVVQSSDSVVVEGDERLDRSVDEGSEAMPGAVVAVEELASGSTVL